MYNNLFPEINTTMNLRQRDRDARVTENVFKSIHAKMVSKMFGNMDSHDKNQDNIHKDPFAKVVFVKFRRSYLSSSSRHLVLATTTQSTPKLRSDHEEQSLRRTKDRLAYMVRLFSSWQRASPDSSKKLPPRVLRKNHPRLRPSDSPRGKKYRRSQYRIITKIQTCKHPTSTKSLPGLPSTSGRVVNSSKEA